MYIIISLPMYNHSFRSLTQRFIIAVSEILVLHLILRYTLTCASEISDTSFDHRSICKMMVDDRGFCNRRHVVGIGHFRNVRKEAAQKERFVPICRVRHSRDYLNQV